MLLFTVSPAGAQPDDLFQRIVEREARTAEARGQYLYRQSMRIEDPGGEYREVREVIFSPGGERTERLVGKPVERLKRLILTEDDFRDLRDIQPLVLTPETRPRYEVKLRGEEPVDGRLCWALDLKPRQIFQGERYFQGVIWVLQADYSVARMEGQAVPPVYRGGTESLFPHFTTTRTMVDGQWWFPALTVADDTLPFRNGPLRIKVRIEYEGYRRFGAQSTITFDPPRLK
jgi:hypothetical protein